MDTVLLLKNKRLRVIQWDRHTGVAPASGLLLEWQTDSGVYMMSKKHIAWGQLTVEFLQAEVLDDNRIKYF